MTARQIARELAVIVFPQLPKDKEKLEKLELNNIIYKAVVMLCNYAKQNLADANGLLLKSEKKLTEIEVEHVNNADKVDELMSVPITTGQLKEQVDLISHALDLVAEALDMPEVVTQCGEENPQSATTEFLCRLIMTYIEHKNEIDQFIVQAGAKWKIERMISIDRDILRLACTEAFFMPDIPINVCISEAVELTNRFADKRAAKYINGILADLAQPAAIYRKTGVITSAEAIETG